MSIGILDIGIGNIGSLRSALYSQGWATESVTEASTLEQVSHLILPGVGSFAEGVRRLCRAGLFDAIANHVAQGKPLLGICLGMQLLATQGNEGGVYKGLSLVPGNVQLFDIKDQFRLPHVGWNSLSVTQEHALLKGIRDNVDFYFVHSYYFKAANSGDIVGVTEYDIWFASFIARKNVVGVQFHPEKSQRNGLKLLDNFCFWDGSC